MYEIDIKQKDKGDGESPGKTQRAMRREGGGSLGSSRPHNTSDTCSRLSAHARNILSSCPRPGPSLLGKGALRGPIANINAVKRVESQRWPRKEGRSGPAIQCPPTTTRGQLQTLFPSSFPQIETLTQRRRGQRASGRHGCSRRGPAVQHAAEGSSRLEHNQRSRLWGRDSRLMPARG